MCNWGVCVCVCLVCVWCVFGVCLVCTIGSCLRLCAWQAHPVPPVPPLSKALEVEVAALKADAAKKHREHTAMREQLEVWPRLLIFCCVCVCVVCVCGVWCVWCVCLSLLSAFSRQSFLSTRLSLSHPLPLSHRHLFHLDSTSPHPPPFSFPCTPPVRVPARVRRGWTGSSSRSQGEGAAAGETQEHCAGGARPAPAAD